MTPEPLAPVILTTWIIESYPLPEGVGSTYQFGVVTAVDIDTARTLVLDQLALLGLDIKNVDPNEIGLIPWFGDNVPFPKTRIAFG